MTGIKKVEVVYLVRLSYHEYLGFDDPESAAKFLKLLNGAVQLTMAPESPYETSKMLLQVTSEGDEGFKLYGADAILRSQIIDRAIDS